VRLLLVAASFLSASSLLVATLHLVGRRKSHARRPVRVSSSPTEALHSLMVREIALLVTPSCVASSCCCQFPFRYRTAMAILSCWVSLLCFPDVGAMMKE
jgi:hypothetical protein